MVDLIWWCLLDIHMDISTERERNDFCSSLSFAAEESKSQRGWHSQHHSLFSGGNQY